MSQFINNIELLGIVGSVRVDDTEDGQVVRFSVVVEDSHIGTDGQRSITMTWLNCVYSSNGEIEPSKMPKRNSKIHLTGRLHNITSTRYDGIVSVATLVIVKSFEILPDDPILMPEEE